MSLLANAATAGAVFPAIIAAIIAAIMNDD